MIDIARSRLPRRQGNAPVLRCDNPFWTFSLAVYAQPGVAAECLALRTAANMRKNNAEFELRGEQIEQAIPFEAAAKISNGANAAKAVQAVPA
jgi:hypothetical protein